MKLRRLALRIAKAWHLVCADVHRMLAARRRDQHGQHLSKAREHDRRADALDRDPTELDGDWPFRPS